MVDAFMRKIIFHLSSLQRSKDCFLEQLRDHPNVPILRYSALWEWQHIVMANAAGVCPVIPPGDLKTIGKGMNQDLVVGLGWRDCSFPSPPSKVKTSPVRVHFAYFTQIDQLEIIAKHLTNRKFLL